MAAKKSFTQIFIYFSKPLRLLYFTQIFIYFSKPLRLLYSLIIYEIVNFSFFTLYSLLLLSFFLYLKSVPIYVIVHVDNQLLVHLLIEWRGFESHLRRIFSRKSEPWVCCVALPCLFVCLCLLLSFFLLSSLIKTCIIM